MIVEVVVEVVIVVVYMAMVVIVDVIVVMVVVVVMIMVNLLVVYVVVRWKIAVTAMASDDSWVVTWRSLVSRHTSLRELLHHLDKLPPVIFEQIVRHR